MAYSRPVDGFRLQYRDVPPVDVGATTSADTPAVVVLHGWPGSARDYRELVPRLSDHRVVVPDLTGFGGSDRHLRDPAEHYSAAAQARSVAALIDELGLDQPVIAGYDVGSRVAQQLATDRPELVGALAVAPPLPGAGDRVLAPEQVQQYWYQTFHQLELSVQLIDGDRAAVRHYLAHFWERWSGPDYEVEPSELEALTDAYARPGAYEASISWYRAGAGTLASAPSQEPPSPERRIAVPVVVTWPENDPLFPPAWSDRLDEWFADVEVRDIDSVGHFVPLEAPDAFAAAVRAAAARRRPH